MNSTIVPDRDHMGIQSQSDYFSHKSAPYVADRKTGMPAGFPTSIVSPAAWTGADFENGHGKEGFTLALDEFDVREIKQACNKLQELGLPLECISQTTFTLPTLGKKLEAMAAELTNGVGFFIIRGLDPQHYSSQVNIAIFLGISSYIGEKRGRQDELGNMLLHLTDLGSALAPENERQAPYSSVGQPFHSDLGDIIGMYALGEAQIGGECNLVSTATVYNEVARARPDVIRLLSSSSWVFDSFGLCPAHTMRPILYPMVDKKVLLSFARRPLVGHAWSPRSPGIPELSVSQIEALDILQTVSEEHALTMKLKRGELLFWNNLALLHSRNGFTDSPDNRRHLLRLWLRNDATEKNWSIPEELQPSWQDAFDHAGRPQLWPIEPIKDRDYVSNQQRSSGHD